MTKTISRQELEADLAQKKSTLLIEALPESYFNDGHLPGAIRINTGEVGLKTALLPSDKSAKVVVYCANAACSNSAKVAEEIETLGYTNVYKYVEGKKDWSEAGLSLEKSA